MSGRSAALFLLLACVAAPVAAGAPARPVPRPDIGPAFSRALCAGQVGNLPFAAWDAGVHDAQIEGRMISRPGGLAVTEPQLEHKARALATLRGAGGYAYGRCDATRGWALALPAPSPLAEGGDGRLKLPLAALGERCESYRADFAPAAGGPARSLPLSAGALSTRELGDGVLSVTCQPRAPRWRGPVLWYLYPVGKGPARAAPDVEGLTGTTVPAQVEALGAWINHQRRKAGIAPLAFRDDLRDGASRLAVDGSLTHDRQLLHQISAGLAEGHTEFLGEDRVRGHDAASMAWLLWNSPRHRDLILRREATVAGLAWRAVGDEQLAVVIVGREAPLNTAKAKPRPVKREKAPRRG